MKTADAVTYIATRLAAAGIEEPRREARILLAAALETDATGLMLRETADPAAFAAHLARREAREPMAYITGRSEFWGLAIATSPATLIPRPDSETLIEAALACFPDRHAISSILDLGTGTGCLLLAALSEFPAAFGIGADISPAAAALATANAKSLNLARRAAFLAGDWGGALNARFDLILSNPPYIPTPDLAALMPEVRDYEPNSALNGGPDGLAAYHILIAATSALLNPGGAAIYEIGVNQLADVTAIAQNRGFAVESRQDLGSHPRALILRCK